MLQAVAENLSTFVHQAERWPESDGMRRYQSIESESLWEVWDHVVRRFVERMHRVK